MYALLRVVDFPEGRCCAYFRHLLPNVSAAYISYVVSFPRVEIQLREIMSILLGRINPMLQMLWTHQFL